MRAAGSQLYIISFVFNWKAPSGPCHWEWNHLRRFGEGWVSCEKREDGDGDSKAIENKKKVEIDVGTDGGNCCPKDIIKRIYN